MAFSVKSENKGREGKNEGRRREERELEKDHDMRFAVSSLCLSLSLPYVFP
jgi:hypothetical protein